MIHLLNSLLSQVLLSWRFAFNEIDPTWFRISPILRVIFEFLRLSITHHGYIHKDIFACLFSIHNTISLSCHEQVCLSGLQSFTFPDDGRSISRNVAHLNILVHDMINLLYHGYTLLKSNLKVSPQKTQLRPCQCPNLKLQHSKLKAICMVEYWVKSGGGVLGYSLIINELFPKLPTIRHNSMRMRSRMPDFTSPFFPPKPQIKWKL